MMVLCVSYYIPLNSPLHICHTPTAYILSYHFLWYLASFIIYADFGHTDGCGGRKQCVYIGHRITVSRADRQGKQRASD